VLTNSVAGKGIAVNIHPNIVSYSAQQQL
jgi:hypothetical protein